MDIPIDDRELAILIRAMIFADLKGLINKEERELLEKLKDFQNSRVS